MLKSSSLSNTTAVTGLAQLRLRQSNGLAR